MEQRIAELEREIFALRQSQESLLVTAAALVEILLSRGQFTRFELDAARERTQGEIARQMKAPMN